MDNLIFNSSISQWYTVTVKSNYEFKFKRDFLEGLSGHNLLNQVDDIFIPIKRFTCEYRNVKNEYRRKIVNDKIISLYVFIKAKMTDELYNYIKGISGYSTLLKAGETPSIMEEKSIDYYRNCCIVDTPIYRGMKIIHKENPFENAITLLKTNVNVKKKVDNLIDKIKRDENYIIQQWQIEKDYKLEMFRSQILKKIYEDETFVTSYLYTNVKDIVDNNHIDFSQIDIVEFSKKLKKMNLVKDFKNLNKSLVKNIDVNDLDKLQKLLATAQKQMSMQQKERTK